ALLEMAALAREDPEDVVRLRECVVVSRPLRETERLLSETDGPRRVPAAMRRETPVPRNAGAAHHVLLAAERGAIAHLSLLPVAAAMMDIRELVLYGRPRRGSSVDERGLVARDRLAVFAVLCVEVANALVDVGCLG